MKNDIMTVDEISEWLRIPKSTLYKLCNEGRIPCTKIGKHWRFKRKTIESWFQKESQNRVILSKFRDRHRYRPKTRKPGTYLQSL